MRDAAEIRTRDGVILRGELQRAGPTWLVLAHDIGSDLDFWRSISLPGRNTSLLAIDLRGHGGSEGDVNDALTARDLVDVIAFARDNGAETVVIGAAGKTVPAALDAAGEAGASGVVAIAPWAKEVNGRSLAKLVIIAGKDDRQVAAGAALQRSSGSAVLVNLPIAGGCAEIVSGPWRTNVEAYIRKFVQDATRPVSRVRP